MQEKWKEYIKKRTEQKMLDSMISSVALDERMEVFLTKEGYIEHSRRIASVLLISPNTFVSTSDDKKILIHIIHDKRDPTRIQTIKMKSKLSQIVQYSDKVFLVADIKGSISGFQYVKGSRKYEKCLNIKVSKGIRKLLKLDQHHFLSVSGDSPLHRIRIEDMGNKETETLEIKELGITNNSRDTVYGLCNSIKKPSHFFFGRREGGNEILMCDFTNSRVAKKYQSHEEEEINCLVSFVNSRDVEILVAGSDDSQLYLYHVEKEKLLQKVELNDTPYCFSINENVLLAGEGGGVLEIFQVSRVQNTVSKIKEVEEYQTDDITDISIGHVDNGIVKVFSGSLDCTVKICLMETVSETGLEITNSSEFKKVGV